MSIKSAIIVTLILKTNIYKSKLIAIQHFTSLDIELYKLNTSIYSKTFDFIDRLYLSVKKDLFESILLTQDMKLPVKKQFYQIWHSVITYALTYPKEYTFLEAFSYSPKISEEVNKQIAELIRPLLRLFELGKQEGIIKNIKCSQMLIFTSGAISSSILKHMLTGDKEKEQLILMAWDAIKN